VFTAEEMVDALRRLSATAANKRAREEFSVEESEGLLSEGLGLAFGDLRTPVAGELFHQVERPRLISLISPFLPPPCVPIFSPV
jgi:hypothetical protein